MHDLPRQKLTELLSTHGLGICDDAKRFEGLLKDLLHNGHKRETFVLVSAVREGIVQELRGPTSGLPPSAIEAKLVRRLCDNLAFDTVAAQWCVESWALALGVKITPPVVATSEIANQKQAPNVHHNSLAAQLTNSIGMRFVLIQSGVFLMGSNELKNESPRHAVEITQPFYLGQFLVTQEEYQSIIGHNPSHFTGNLRFPVDSVSWSDAVAFCERLEQLDSNPKYGLSYRLPTEAEWEYACRAGSDGKWCCGDTVSDLRQYAWIYSNCEGIQHPVGKKKANAWGLYDMHGTVQEWCLDAFDAGLYRQRLGTTKDPFFTSGTSNRVLRGGDLLKQPRYVRSAYRSKQHAGFGFMTVGFRVVLGISR